MLALCASLPVLPAIRFFCSIVAGPSTYLLRVRIGGFNTKVASELDETFAGKCTAGFVIGMIIPYP